MNAEKFELGIACGLQDRVAQIYNGVTFMDFEQTYLEANGYGRYERLDPSAMPNIYIAYDPNRAEESGKAHKKVKKLFQQQNQNVVAAMSEFADIAQKGRDALVAGNLSAIPALVNANFDLRDRIFNVAEENRRMVLEARKCGASAKFAGSGGAIVGTYEDESQFAALCETLGAIGCRTVKPKIASDRDEKLVIESAANWRNS
jgi:glucuronokinase